VRFARSALRPLSAASPTLRCALPRVFSTAPCACLPTLPVTLPSASLVAPLISWPAPFTRFLSMGGSLLISGGRLAAVRAANAGLARALPRVATGGRGRGPRASLEPPVPEISTVSKGAARHGATVHFPDAGPDQGLSGREKGVREHLAVLLSGREDRRGRRNGSGKSTLLKIMAGLDKDFTGEAKP